MGGGRGKKKKKDKEEKEGRVHLPAEERKRTHILAPGQVCAGGPGGGGFCWRIVLKSCAAENASFLEPLLREVVEGKHRVKFS